MVKDGLIERTVHPKDSRFVLLQLTQTGNEIAKKVKIIEEEIYGMIEKMLTEKELKAANEILEKFLRAFPVRETLISRGYCSLDR